MRGSICKKLRRESNTVAMMANEGKPVPYVDYDFKSYKKIFMDLLTGKPKQYTVYTVSMLQCERLIYKRLKKAVKDSSSQG